jgi:hypothetical protein
VADRLQFVENAAQTVPPELQTQFRSAETMLRAQLGPRLPQLVMDSDKMVLRNIVGSFALPNDSVVDVVPKTPVGQDWPQAVVDLLEPTTRLTVAGSRRSEPTARRALSGALALEYARRLESALKADGPILAYTQIKARDRKLDGKLNVTEWIRTALLDPARFPITRDHLTSGNDFARGLSIVAGLLGRAADNGELSATLHRLQVAVVPGQPVPSYVSPHVALRPLPSQWSKYRPAWDIAAALLRHRSVIGDPGRAVGLEVAVEPWPLLETALTRALKSLEAGGGGWQHVSKGKHRLLSVGSDTRLNVEPDGLLRRRGQIAASFECKYTLPGRTPDEGHVHQTLTTAAAVSSPIAVIVYPTDQAVNYYKVSGFDGYPYCLVTMGLSLFEYRRIGGDEKRAKALADAIAGARSNTLPVDDATNEPD